ncbi:MAG TPA: hypothetical protein VFW52_01255 [Candidatus Saccharimonadales bacterium]|nr:hypothetical protein [Candidatus Saccharimonadales bacterium]
MEKVTGLNKEVNVVGYYFKNAGRRLLGFPKKVEFDGRSVVFTDNGRRRPLNKAGRQVQLFRMSDGQASYQLEFDAADASWKLLSIGA